MEYKFKIYFGRYKKNTDYLEVVIYKTRNEYKKWCKKVDGFETAAQTFIKLKDAGKNKGKIIFDGELFGPAILAHELQHASIHYWTLHKGLKLSDIKKNEEDFCDVIAWLFHWCNIELSKIYN